MKRYSLRICLETSKNVKLKNAQKVVKSNLPKAQLLTGYVNKSKRKKIVC